jgi:hypothetical protein
MFESRQNKENMGSFFLVLASTSALMSMWRLRKVFLSSAVLGENPRYCHSQIVVSCRPPASCSNLNIALKSKFFHLQLWNFICRCTLMSSTRHTHFWVTRSKVKITVTSKKYSDMLSFIQNCTRSRALAPVLRCSCCYLLHNYFYKRCVCQKHNAP